MLSVVRDLTCKPRNPFYRLGHGHVAEFDPGAVGRTPHGDVQLYITAVTLFAFRFGLPAPARAKALRDRMISLLRFQNTFRTKLPYQLIHHWSIVHIPIRYPFFPQKNLACPFSSLFPSCLPSLSLIPIIRFFSVSRLDDVA